MLLHALTQEELVAHKDADKSPASKWRPETREMRAEFNKLIKDDNPFAVEVPAGTKASAYRGRLRSTLRGTFASKAEKDTVEVKLHNTIANLVLVFKITPKDDGDSTGKSKQNRGNSTK